MRAAVLLSAGLHPVSGRRAPVPVEAQATRLALALGAEVRGFHAGAGEAVRDHLGHGLDEILLAPAAPDGDPLPGLLAALEAWAPDLVLAGRRGQGGADSGMLPYRVARALDVPIVADAASLSVEAGVLAADQALPRGARRRLRAALPCVVTVHPAAPPPLPFNFGAARRGRVTALPVAAEPGAELPSVEERSYRPRPRVLGAASGGTAAERLRAATEAASSGGQLLVHPAPDVAAAEIAAFLRRVGVLRVRS